MNVSPRDRLVFVAAWVAAVGFAVGFWALVGYGIEAGTS